MSSKQYISPAVEILECKFGDLMIPSSPPVDPMAEITNGPVFM